MDRVITFRE
jgi:hypothetical protein